MTRTIRAVATAALTLLAGLGLALALVTVAQAAPTLSVAPSAFVTGASIHATAQLGGGNSPGGEVAFALYGPADAQCGGTPVFSSTVAVTGNGAYDSGPFRPEHAGVHRWVARYGGDAGNGAAQSGCDAPGTTVTVPKARRTLTLAPSAGVVVGRSVRAIATLGEPTGVCPPVTRAQGWGCLRGRSAPASVAFAPTGTIAFRLYGPEDPTCAASPAFTDAVAVAQDGPHASAELATARAGVYRWTATFSGDADNEAVATACGAAPEVTVAKATPVLSVGSSRGVGLGGSVRATGTFTGGFEVGGEVAVALHGPDDERCTGTPVFSSAVAAAGDGAYDSEPFRPERAGTYRWVLSYPGDANNEPAATRCDDAAAAVVVSPAPLASPPPGDPRPPAAAPPAAPRPALEPAIERFALASRCVRPAANGRVGVVLLLRTARAGAVRVQVERALGTRGRDRCPARNGGGRFTGRYQTVATVREARTQAAAAALARRLTLRLRLRPALYRITVRAHTSGGRLSPPKRRYVRVLAPR